MSAQPSSLSGFARSLDPFPGRVPARGLVARRAALGAFVICAANTHLRAQRESRVRAARMDASRPLRPRGARSIGCGAFRAGESPCVEFACL